MSILSLLPRGIVSLLRNDGDWCWLTEYMGPSSENRNSHSLASQLMPTPSQWIQIQNHSLSLMHPPNQTWLVVTPLLFFLAEVSMHINYCGLRIWSEDGVPFSAYCVSVLWELLPSISSSSPSPAPIPSCPHYCFPFWLSIPCFQASNQSTTLVQDRNPLGQSPSLPELGSTLLLLPSYEDMSLLTRLSTPWNLCHCWTSRKIRVWNSPGDSSLWNRR